MLKSRLKSYNILDLLFISYLFAIHKNKHVCLCNGCNKSWWYNKVQKAWPVSSEWNSLTSSGLPTSAARPWHHQRGMGTGALLSSNGICWFLLSRHRLRCDTRRHSSCTESPNKSPFSSDKVSMPGYILSRIRMWLVGWEIWSCFWQICSQLNIVV